MINTSSGGTLVLKEGVSGFFLQELSSTGEVIRIQETVPIKKESKVSEDEYVSDDQILQEEQNLEVKGPEGIQGIVESGNWDVGFSDSKIEPQNIEVIIDKIEYPKEVETMADEVISDNKVNEKFISFREKFLDFESKCDTFENDIIQKMTRRAERLKEFSEVLDKENDYLEEFKKEKLG